MNSKTNLDLYDEVYGSLSSSGYFDENSPLSPNNPYSVSKASADMLVNAYSHTYGLPINITRCSNNYGLYQFPEKFIPLVISQCINDMPVPIYGDGLQIRDWIHVMDHCSAIDAVLHKGVIGEIYNIGSHSEMKNIDIAKLIIHLLGKDEKLITFVNDRPGHDRRYAIDNTKIVSKLGWKPTYSFEEGIEHTVNWYIENEEWMKEIYIPNIH